MINILKLITALALASLACLGSAIRTEEPHPTPPETASHPTQTQPRTHPASPEQTCAIVTASASLHIRDQPDHESAVRGYLFHAETVTISDSTNPDWWIIKAGKRSGWARADYLDIVPCLDE